MSGAGSGLTFTANVLSLEGRRHLALIETGSDASLFGAQQVFLKANTLYASTVIPNSSNTLIRLRPTKKLYNGLSLSLSLSLTHTHTHTLSLSLHCTQPH